MGERAFALWRAGDDDRRFRVSVAATKDGVAFDRRRACILLDQFGHRAAPVLGFGLIVEILRNAGGGDGRVAQHAAMIVGCEAAVGEQEPKATLAAQRFDHDRTSTRLNYSHYCAYR